MTDKIITVKVKPEKEFNAIVSGELVKFLPGETMQIEESKLVAFHDVFDVIEETAKEETIATPATEEKKDDAAAGTAGTSGSTPPAGAAAPTTTPPAGAPKK